MVENSIKIELVFKLGGKCITCGEQDPQKLEIDYKDQNHFLEYAWFRADKEVMYLNYLMNFAEESKYLQVKCTNCYPILDYNESEHLVVQAFAQMQTDLSNKKYDKMEKFHVILYNCPKLMQTTMRFFRIGEKYLKQRREALS